MKYDLVVYIGRFQPFHNGHKDIVEKISLKAKKTLIIVGSIDSPRSIKNPFSFEERKAMIKNSVHVQYLSVSGVLDYTYDNNRWIKAVSEIVKSECPNGRIAIAGHFKDNSSNYLNYFPQWDLIEMDSYSHYGDQVNATNLRNLYYEGKFGYIQNYMPNYVFGQLLEFKTHLEYILLKDEYEYNKEYRKQWETPFPSIFVTVDAIVVQSGHVLLIQRKNTPGKDLWAMPGGFIDVNETIETSMIRELREETCLKVPEKVLRGSISKVEVFDRPGRAQRGRIITHVYLIELNDTEKLPKVKGSDDAIAAKWIPIGDFFQMRKQMFSDHWHIVESIL